jgi:hypothetical protein
MPIVCAVALMALLSACSIPKSKIVLETRDGFEISLRPEKYAPRPAPGPEFQDLKDFKIARSLNRVIVRYGRVISFNRSDPVPLFSEDQVRVLTEILLRELPALPADQRIGLFFSDQYRHDVVDVEIYPEGDYLVYDFRALMVLRSDYERGSQYVSDYGILFLQRDQIKGKSRYPVLKDPIASAARPDLRLPDDSDKKKEASPL